MCSTCCCVISQSDPLQCYNVFPVPVLVYPGPPDYPRSKSWDDGNDADQLSLPRMNPAKSHQYESRDDSTFDLH